MRFAPCATVRNVCGWLFPIVAVLACAGESREPSDTSAASAAIADTARFESPVLAIPAADILAALADTDRWPAAPVEARRRCKGTPACDRTTDPAKFSVRLWAEKGSKDVGHRDAGTEAILIGKMQALGSAAGTTLRYNLAPGVTYAVYLMQEGGAGRYEIWSVQGANKTMVDSGVQIECNHGRTWRYSFAMFTDCDNPPPEHLLGGGTAMDAHLKFTAGIRPTTHDDGPAWFTCTSGCCTAGPQ